MSIRTYENKPYVDDFAEQDPFNNGKTAEEKNFLRILFKPGVSVQVRELNQMQSILQNQIDKLGRGVYKEGPVPELADEANLDSSIFFVDIDFTNVLAENPPYLDNLIPHLGEITKIRYDKGVGGVATDQLDAEVLHYRQLESDNHYRFFIKYLTSTQDELTGANISEYLTDFQILLGEEINIPELLIDHAEDINLGTVVNSGKAIYAKTTEGTYFVKGQFVYSEEQTVFAALPVREYVLNADVSFRIRERIVNYQMDKSLLDNAQGYPNERAPGADRYTIELDLVIQSKDTSDNDKDFIAINDTNVIGYNNTTEGLENYISLLKVENNVVVKVARPEFTAIMDVLAERTREQSGDFTVEPAVIDIKDFYNDVDDENNRGVYTVANMADLDIVIPDSDISNVSAGDLSSKSNGDKIKFGKSRLIVGVEPTVAYVNGYRIENESKLNLIVPKSRKTSGILNAYTTARLGSYIEGDSVSGVPAIDVDRVYYFNNDVGQCRIRSIEKTGGGTYRLYIYDININPDKTLDGSNSLSGADIDVDFTFANNSSGFTLYNSQYNKSIYSLPADFVKHVNSGENDIEFTARTILSAVAPGSGNDISLTLTNGRFEETGSESFIVIVDNVYKNVDSYVIDPNENGDTATVKLTLDSPFTGTETNIYAIVSYRDHLVRKTKTIKGVTGHVLSTAAFTTGETFTLDRHDVFNLVSASDENGGDIPLEHFELIGNQKDGYYDLSQLKYIGGGNITGLTVSYEYYRHSGGDYFTVNSYTGAGIDYDYEDIPNYKDVRLADALDFRPRTAHSHVVLDEDESAYNVDETGTYLDPNSTIDLQLEYYLSRMDKLVANKNDGFSIIQGIPAIQPSAPATPPESLHLYTLFVPPYTFHPKDVFTDFVDNRRYTMRDIGEIESRVQNLEYYTSLSLLEREANGKQIFETSAGNPYDRFKNGIIVDSFQGHNVGNVTDPHYNCSMDPDEQVLRPYFTTRNVTLKDIPGEDNKENIEINNGLLTLSHTTHPTPFVSQQKASVNISVNPYDVSTWLGNLGLSPSSDEWMETRRAPNVVNEVGGNLADLQAEVNRVNALGTQWNSWQTSWTGRPQVTREREWRKGSGIPWGRGPGRGWLRWTTWHTTQSKDIREGIRNTASISTVTQVKDDRVINVDFVPFIRSRRIYFKGELFKPNTKLNLFFDGIDITKYATSIVSADYVEWKDGANVRTFHNQKSTAIPLLNGSTDLLTDEHGRIYGWFIIPNNSEHQFPIGERRVILSDGKTATDAGATTTGDATYTATGKVQTKQRTLVTTRTVVRRQERVSQSRIRTSRTIANRTEWYDPLAQSFIVGENPTGLYIDKINLYFSHKSTKNIPLKAYIVEMENGMPTQRRVPLSEVVKMPDEVNVSADASVATEFVFPSPVYLQYGIEYAVVTESNSSQYRQWLSEVGGTDVKTGEFISKNPFLGVSFKSQNASTWTPDQMKDFKMDFYRADYATSGSIILKATGIELEVDNGETFGDGPLEFSQIQLNTDFVDHPETDVKFEISIQNGAWEVIEPNENHYISTSAPLTLNNDVKIKISLSTSDSKITPTVDLERISIIAVKNEINGTNDVVVDGVDTEKAAEGGNALATYMTREVVLNNPSDRLDTYLNINLLDNSSDIRVYARFKNSDEDIITKDFEHIPPQDLIPINGYGDYSEIRFIKDFSTTIETFSSFQVKIVMVSNSHAVVPTVKDFRAVATI